MLLCKPRPDATKPGCSISTLMLMRLAWALLDADVTTQILVPLPRSFQPVRELPKSGGQGLHSAAPSQAPARVLASSSGRGAVVPPKSVVSTPGVDVHLHAHARSCASSLSRVLTPKLQHHSTAPSNASAAIRLPSDRQQSRPQP